MQTQKLSGRTGVGVQHLELATLSGATWWVFSTLHWPLYLGEKPWYTLYKRLGEPEGRAGQAWKNKSLDPQRGSNPEPSSL
jgi:hypothetical protein